jgi:hypothetical protein
MQACSAEVAGSAHDSTSLTVSAVTRKTKQRSGWDVTLYESEKSFGGHTLTDETIPGVPVDLGFQVRPRTRQSVAAPSPLSLPPLSRAKLIRRTRSRIASALSRRLDAQTCATAERGREREKEESACVRARARVCRRERDGRGEGGGRERERQRDCFQLVEVDFRIELRVERYALTRRRVHPHTHTHGCPRSSIDRRTGTLNNFWRCLG